MGKWVEIIVKCQFTQAGLGPEHEAGEGIHSSIEWVIKFKGNV